MRIAFCLCGMLGQESGKWARKASETINPEISYRQYNHHLLSKNKNVDTFLHIRNLDYEDQLLNLYKPKKYLSEPYKDFDTEKFCVGDQLLSAQRDNSKAMWSKFYSLYKAVEQKRKYEEENNFKYDCVFVSRYDLLPFEDFIFSDYDMNYFHAPFSIWHMRKRAYFVGNSTPDLWFFSSSGQIDEFATLFLNVEKYAKDTGGNCISQHFAVHQKLREMEAKLRFVLNADVHDCDDVTRCAVARMRSMKYWSYDNQTKINELKQNYRDKLNRESYDMDWDKFYQDHWSLYKGMTSTEFNETQKD